MLILSIIFVELLILMAVYSRLYYYYKKADCTYESISVGVKPKLYQKEYKGIKFIFNLFPVFADYDFKTYNYSKFKSINEYTAIFIGFLSVAIPHAVLILTFNGFDFLAISYKILITGQLSEAENTIFRYNLGKLVVQPTKFFFVAVFSTAVAYVWYIVVLRNLIYTLLDKLATFLKISFNNTNSYLVATSILLYYHFTGNSYLLMLISAYPSLIYGLIDWLIAHFILILVAALILEILSRISKEKSHSTL